jgi:predicted AAA+ superfamily ATPase
MDLYPPPVVYDEIQYAPELLPYIKEWVDAHRDRAGQFLLTGSQNLLLMQQVPESLAGRAAVLKLLPLTQREIARPRPATGLGEAPAARNRRGPRLRGAVAADPARVLSGAGAES